MIDLTIYEVARRNMVAFGEHYEERKKQDEINKRIEEEQDEEDNLE